jgi:hypothetical protein
MPDRILLPLWMWLVTAVTGTIVSAQDAETSVETPVIHQVSPSAWQNIVNARSSASEGMQIRVTVQYLMVDSKTRDDIYAGLDRQSIVSSLQPPRGHENVDLGQKLPRASMTQTIHAPARVTSYTLGSTEFKDVLGKAVASADSDVNVAPKIILLDGNHVEMTDLVQRPFVIDFLASDQSVEPVAHVLDEGTRLRMVANLSDAADGVPPSIELQCELTVMRILDVMSDTVFGIADEPLTAQVPIQQITTAAASQSLANGQALLIDPHVTKTRAIGTDVGTPILAKLPYLNKTFRNSGPRMVEQHMILLLQPSIESKTR